MNMKSNIHLTVRFDGVVASNGGANTNNISI